jgi:hypothetical protein
MDKASGESSAGGLHRKSWEREFYAFQKHDSRFADWREQLLIVEDTRQASEGKSGFQAIAGSEFLEA